MNWKLITGNFALALLLAVIELGAQTPSVQRPYTSWSDYGGSADSMQYSALREITKNNVSQLELAWFYQVPDRKGNFGFNPVIVDGVMYVLGAANAIVALDAATGRLIWSSGVEGGSPGSRGINYWESKDRSDRRLIYTAGGAIREIDARTGAPIKTFGLDGRVNMREATPRPLGGPSGTPGRVFENLFITGSNTGEQYGSPPGDVRAFDVITGKLVWTFHTIPHPGEFGYETWPKDAWQWAGGANAWGEISVDTQRGIAYFPLGSPTHDSYGGDRPGANLFGNSLLALDARTGKRLWHFQTIHHDIWDYDLTTAPKLLTIRRNGKPIDVVAQPTKFGYLYVFDRVTGAPIWPIEERPVPATDVPGEQVWATQPLPTKPPPFARLKFGLDEINPHLDEPERARLRKILENARNEGLFTPQTLTRDQISTPGEFGGSNWGGSAADPSTGMLYVRSSDQPALHKLREPTPPAPSDGGPAASGQSNANRVTLPPIEGITRYTGPLGTLFRAANGLPAISPPWAEIVAYDLNEGTIKWRATLGTVRALADRGVPDTGSPENIHRNGLVATAGGLIFAGTWGDMTIRAFDKDTGTVLWKHEIEANPEGLPAVYEAGGRQFIVFCAAGSRTRPAGTISYVAGKPEAQGYYVFALPRRSTLR